MQYFTKIKNRYSKTVANVRVSLNSKNRVAFNFAAEVVKLLPKYIMVGMDGERLYFLESTPCDGYSLGYQKSKNGMTGARICITAGEENLHLFDRFVGCHNLYKNETGLYILANEADLVVFKNESL